VHLGAKRRYINTLPFLSFPLLSTNQQPEFDKASLLVFLQNYLITNNIGEFLYTISSFTFFICAHIVFY